MGVDVHYQTEVTPESVSQYKPDVLVAATGSHAKTITLPGSGKPVNAEDILLEKSSCGSKVLVVGGGLVGCETALWLAQQGKEVNVVEVLPEILGGHGALPHMNEFMLRDLLKYHKIGIHTNAKVLDTNADTATIQEGDQSYELPAETIVLSVGYESNDKLYDELKDLDIPVYNVGDSSKVHNIMYSIWNAYEVARNL